MSVIGKAAKHLLKKKSRSYTKKKASKKTRIARNKAKKHKDWEHDLASEEFAYKNPGQRVPSKKALIGKKPPSKRVDPKRKKKHELDLP